MRSVVKVKLSVSWVAADSTCKLLSRRNRTADTYKVDRKSVWIFDGGDGHNVGPNNLVCWLRGNSEDSAVSTMQMVEPCVQRHGDFRDVKSEEPGPVLDAGDAGSGRRFHELQSNAQSLNEASARACRGKEFFRHHKAKDSIKCKAPFNVDNSNGLIPRVNVHTPELVTSGCVSDGIVVVMVGAIHQFLLLVQKN
jgi:hypothetical protein